MVGALVEIADGLERDQHNEQGFGFFASAKRSRMVSLPVRVPELLEVGPIFHVKPLLGVVGRDQRFHVLALDPGDARLYVVTPYDWTELPLDVMPDLLDEVPLANGAGRAADFPDHVKGDLARVAAAARLALGDDPAPVLLVAEPDIARYVRQLNLIPTLHQDALLLDPFTLTAEELLERALTSMRSVVDAEPEAVVARATRGRGRKDVGVSLDDILTRARNGKVEVVVVAGDVVVRAGSGATPVAESSQKAASGPDLLNEAAVETLRQGGRAFTLPSERLPAGVPAVAIYRS